ncbi:hypothetical protein AB0M46_25410 [Dactylosporangium sp. NPDC051485]|uniref:hypothetical protein n=1 Tax=Dactylosporangium sp. NPDC051485 TaxID=3154846 RepID=UPI00341971E1
MATALVSAGKARSCDYTHKPSAADVHCYYVVHPSSPHGEWALEAVLRPAFRALLADYGIAAVRLEFGDVPPVRPDAVTYLVYGPTDPLEMSSAEREYLAALAAEGIRTNVISAYALTPSGADRPGYEAARTVVPALCDELGINALYPDEIDRVRGIRTNTWQDVYINAIGETIRVKYRPTESLESDDAQVRGRLRREHAADVAELARLHREFHLWQRKPYTDGSIMFPHDGYWFVSQTMTDKTRMTSDDYDLITSFDEGLRGITYAGPRLPSSDSPEFLMLSSLMSMHGRRPRLIVHFHHRELTRGPRYRDLVTDTTIEGGQFAAGRLFFGELRRRGTDWFIIREHGMVWVGNSVGEFGAFVSRVVARP